MSFTPIDNAAFSLSPVQFKRYCSLVQVGRHHSKGWRKVSRSISTLKRDWDLRGTSAVQHTIGTLVAQKLVRREGPCLLVSTGGFDIATGTITGTTKYTKGRVSSTLQYAKNAARKD